MSECGNERKHEKRTSPGEYLDIRRGVTDRLTDGWTDRFKKETYLLENVQDRSQVLERQTKNRILSRPARKL